MQNSDSATVDAPQLVSDRDQFIAALRAAFDAKRPGEVVQAAAPLPELELRTLLHATGFTRVHRFTPSTGKEDGFACLQAVKPDFSPITGVIAVMSLPRYGLTTTFGSITKALLPLRIPLQQGGGVYWSEVLTELFRGTITSDARYILTIDYDSIFDNLDVLNLVRLMEQTPDAGAICATQMRRTKPTVLATLPDGVTEAPAELFEPELTQLKTAHFGLTLFRTDALRRLSRPWFQAIPDSEGEWKPEKGYVAADVAFWLKFHAEGHKLYQANTVAIGHIEEMIIWPDHRLSPVIQSSEDYRAKGIPDEALR